MMEQFDAALRLAGARIVDSIANFLPGALVLLVLLIFSLVVAIAVRVAVRRGLESLDFDRYAESVGISPAGMASSQSASVVTASFAYWAVLLMGLLLGLTALDASLPSQFAVAVLSYLPHLVAALLIMVAGSVVARFLGRAVLIGAVNMGVQHARLLGVLVKWLVLIVAAAMALEHLGIGRTVLLLAFGIVFGGMVLAMAIAVGLGARDIVGRALERQVREGGGVDRVDHV